MTGEVGGGCGCETNTTAGNDTHTKFHAQFFFSLSFWGDLLLEVDNDSTLTCSSSSSFFSPFVSFLSHLSNKFIITTVDYVKDRVKRVYTHGSPPVATVMESKKASTSSSSSSSSRHTAVGTCPILDAFDLPTDLVYGFVQPYDPVVRLFTDVDALYPLVDDLGKDQVTLYATGPPRSLRPIVRTIFASWEGWPRFRDNWKGSCSNQRYQSVGIQHVLLPEPLRYLNDRFFSVNVGVPPTEVIVRISSSELLPALHTMFPLDVFQISLIPQAVRRYVQYYFGSFPGISPPKNVH
jgi:hypothetical protein